MLGIPPMVQPSAASTAAFVAVVAAVAVMVVLGTRAAWQRLGEPPAATRRATAIAAVAVLAWLVLTAAASASGVLERSGPPPPAMLFMAGCNLVAVVVACSRLGARWVDGLPVAALVGFHAFRLPLELVLHRWYEEGTLPVQMTYAGRNFDIVTGILAVVVGLWLWRGRPSPAATRVAVGLFTLVGLGLLLTVATIAVLSSPFPFRVFTNEPAVVLVFHVPYVWILPMCVAPALAGHILGLRWLLRTRAR